VVHTTPGGINDFDSKIIVEDLVGLVSRPS
jgi:hypothetical protein